MDRQIDLEKILRNNYQQLDEAVKNNMSLCRLDNHVWLWAGSGEIPAGYKCDCKAMEYKLNSQAPQPLPSKGKIECKHKGGQIMNAVNGCDSCARQLPEIFASPTKEWKELRKILIDHSADRFGNDCFDLDNCEAVKQLKSFISSLLKEQELRHIAQLAAVKSNQMQRETVIKAEEREKITDLAFDWVWDGWNLDLGNKDRAKQHFLDSLKERKP